MPHNFDPHSFATQELPAFTKLLAHDAVHSEATTSAPPLDMDANFADGPAAEAVSIAMAAAEITGQCARVETPSYTQTGPAPDTFTV